RPHLCRGSLARAGSPPRPGHRLGSLSGGCDYCTAVNRDGFEQSERSNLESDQILQRQCDLQHTIFSSLGACEARPAKAQSRIASATLSISRLSICVAASTNAIFLRGGWASKT